MSSILKRATGTAVALALVCLTPASFAAPSQSDKAAAETLFVEARTLFSAGKYAEACKALEESQRLDPGTGTLLNLGRCYEKLGQTASAWSTYREAASSARANGESAREQTARHSADALEPKLAKITVMVPESARAKGLEVRRDGAQVPSGTWGFAVAIDPGDHVFEASAPGSKPWRSHVAAEPGKSVAVTVPPLEPDPNAVVAAKAAAPEGAVPAQGGAVTGPAQIPGAIETPAHPDIGGQRIAALFVGGVGVVVAGIGGAFALSARSTYDGADCNAQGVCTDSGLATRSRAYDKANVATFLTVGGLIGVAGGAVLWFTAPPRRGEAASAISKPHISIGAQPFGLNGVRSLDLIGSF